MSYHLIRPIGGHDTAFVDILYLDETLPDCSCQFWRRVCLYPCSLSQTNKDFPSFRQNAETTSSRFRIHLYCICYYIILYTSNRRPVSSHTVIFSSSPLSHHLWRKFKPALLMVCMTFLTIFKYFFFRSAATRYSYSGRYCTWYILDHQTSHRRQTKILFHPVDLSLDIR
jgi:hypothetical protein